MPILLNELSLHGQFHTALSFQGAINDVMKLRQVAKSFGHNIKCHKNIVLAKITPDKSMIAAINSLPDRNKARSVMAWITKEGPFWNEGIPHSPDDYMQHRTEVVTETAIGEATFTCINETESSLISFMPSNWDYSPIDVQTFSDNGDEIESTNVRNDRLPPDISDSEKHPDYERELSEISDYLMSIQTPIKSWAELKEQVVASCTEIYFSEDAFEPLMSHPFVTAAANRIVLLLQKLNQLKSCFDKDGNRTAEGHEIYQNFFTGEKIDGGRGAPFTDSSSCEKDKYKDKLTFKHPKGGNDIFCPYHGKTQTPQYRIHFSWPMRADETFYVVYVGPKLTK